jgi:hypothetical protein
MRRAEVIRFRLRRAKRDDRLGVRVCPGRVKLGLVGWAKPTNSRPFRWVSPTLQRSDPASGTDS